MRRIPLPERLASRMEVYCLSLRLDEEPHDVLPLLSETERRMAARYRRCADRVRFARTRAATRILLSRRLNCPPQAIEIAPGAFNKPEIRGCATEYRPAPLFNVSHSGDFALIAIGDSVSLANLGVDIEQCDPALDPFQIAEIGCTEHEKACLSHSPDPLQTLYPIWVAKEAVLKAVGVGIADHLQSVSIELRSGAEIGVRCHVADWHGMESRALEIAAGYAAALAWRDKGGIANG
ncbi:MAG: 4'-phosphopantetheinyl transferase superfamily protein [Azoarcus sp.]|jgi:4'-phosphopantetheinyl transferase|nr:4'-phosphopantetheinyl transferase superfamily protein [Azoarcus sp.]